MTEQLSNFGVTTVGEELDASETGVTVSDGSVFPDEGNFRVNVDDELMLVTSRSTNDLTVVRGAEGTTATSHAINSAIKQVLTAGGLLAAIQELHHVTAVADIGCIATRSGSQTITNGLGTSNPIDWTSSVKDTDGLLDIGGSNPDRITVPAGQGGWYHVEAQWKWTNNGTNERQAFIHVNGAATNHGRQWNIGSSSYFQFVSISGLVYVNGGDYITIDVRQLSGGNITIDGCYIQVLKAAPAATTADAIGAKVYNDGTQGSLAAATHNQLDLDTVDYDTDGFWSAGNPTRLTVPPGLAGTYLAYGTTRVNQAWQAFLSVTNDAGQLYYGGGSASSAQDTQAIGTFSLNAGDYVEFDEYHSSGTGIAGHASAREAQTELSLMLLYSNGDPTRAGNQRLLTANVTYTSGDVVLSGTSGPVSLGVPDVQVAANAGDVLLCSSSHQWAAESTDIGALDMATWVDGAAVNYVSGASEGASHRGVIAWKGENLNDRHVVGGSVQYIVQPGDVENGNVTMKMVGNVNANTVTLNATDSNTPWQYGIVNLKAGGDGTAVLPSERVTLTSGDITINTTGTMTAISGAVVSTPANVGDVLAVWAGGRYINGGSSEYAFLDAFTMVGGSKVNGVSGAAEGYGAWQSVEQAKTGFGGTILYTVVSGDIENGNVTLQLHWEGGAVPNLTLKAAAANPLEFGVFNLKASGDIKAFGTAGRGHTFPPNPPIGEEFLRTDLHDELYFYDGNRWLSRTIYALPPFVPRAGFASPISATGYAEIGWPDIDGNDIYVIDFWCDTYPTSASASNYFTLSAFGVTVTLWPVTNSASNRSVNNVNDVVLFTNYSSNLTMSETGSGSSYYFSPGMSWRKIAT